MGNEKMTEDKKVFELIKSGSLRIFRLKIGRIGMLF
tara:strand:- start:502 stop:609 length:108 start_codon:yes stop_codon:yes gene_type:complete